MIYCIYLFINLEPIFWDTLYIVICRSQCYSSVYWLDRELEKFGYFCIIPSTRAGCSQTSRYLCLPSSTWDLCTFFWNCLNCLNECQIINWSKPMSQQRNTMHKSQYLLISEGVNAHSIIHSVFDIYLLIYSWFNSLTWLNVGQSISVVWAVVCTEAIPGIMRGHYRPGLGSLETSTSFFFVCLFLFIYVQSNCKTHYRNANIWYVCDNMLVGSAVKMDKLSLNFMLPGKQCTYQLTSNAAMICM